MLLSDIETCMRQDLFDSSAARWATSDIDRAIDKAVDRYSQYYPNVAYSDMQMQPYQRTYPYPASWNTGYPVLWIEKILYPLQVYGTGYAAPSSAPNATAVSGSGLNVGRYCYSITYLTQGGETLVGPVTTVDTTPGNQQVLLTSIPTAPSQPQVAGIATNTVIGRIVYRSQVGGSTMQYLTTLQDNTSTSYTDSTPDAQLTSGTLPTVNTSGVMVWPPLERSFSEYSNMYDSNTALARGGNMGPGGSIGDAPGVTGSQEASFTLNLSPMELPKDTTLVMRIFYATRQQLDASGSTIPEVHRDVIVLGATGYAMEAYQVPTNDNFDFQDGSLHDRIDDTSIPPNWLAATRYKLERFEQRLQEIKQQRDFASSARAQWGDVPVRWMRL